MIFKHDSISGDYTIQQCKQLIPGINTSLQIRNENDLIFVIKSSVIV